MCCRPVNLLQSMHSHFIHTVVFGAMASDILANIFNPTAEFIVDVYSTPWSSSESSVMQLILIIVNKFLWITFSTTVLWSSDTPGVVLFPSTDLHSCTYWVHGLFLWSAVFLLLVRSNSHITSTFTNNHIFSSGIRLYHLESLSTNCAFYRGDLVRYDQLI